MKELVPCTSCQRHVRCDEEMCPFCGATVEQQQPEAPASLRLPRHQLTRAAIFAGAVLLAPGCGDSDGSKKSVEPTPAASTSDAAADVAAPPDAAAADATVADASAPDAQVKKKKKRRKKPPKKAITKPEPIPDEQPMPYGAPPLRYRVV